MPKRPNPLPWIGLALLVLGAGNWATAGLKLARYRAELEGAAVPSPLAPPAGFSYLDETNNRRLLAWLDRRAAVRSRPAAKATFYRTVAAGGRLLVLTGSVLLLSGLVRERSARRTGRR